MRKPLFSRGFLLAGVCLLSLAVLPGIGENAQSAKRVPGIFDWSMRHVIYPRTGPIDKMIAAQRDPRARLIWQHELGRPYGQNRTRGRAGTSGSTAKRDWSIYLGLNGVAPAMYPAKYNFSITATPSCTNDFVVYPINAPGSATQPNIVALNNLYSGTTAGLCSGTSANVYWSYNVQGIAGGGAVTTSPSLSYDESGTGSGTKVAFVESGSGSAHFHVLAWGTGANNGQNASDLQSVGLGEIFSASVDSAHRGVGYAVGNTGTISGGSTANGAALAEYTVQSLETGPPAGRVASVTITTRGLGYSVGGPFATTRTAGRAGGAGTGLEVDIASVGAPKTINTFVSTTPAINGGTATATATDLVFGSSTDTLSAPFIDYVTDRAYVGNDAGQLYRIKDVFCMAAGGNPDCTSESSGPAPSIDPTWGSGGYVQVCAGKLSSPVLDGVTNNVFVGCSDGKLYSISQTGTVSSLQVGTGTTYGGIVDPPLVDGLNGFVYAVSGSGSASGGASGVLVQAKTTNLSSYVAVPIGTGNDCNIHEPAPNYDYLTGITTAGASLYVGGATGTIPSCTAGATASGTADIYLYGLTFGTNGIIKTTPTSTSEGGGPGYEWAPLTEFYNAAEGDDWLLVGTLQDQDNVESYTLNKNPNTTGGITQEGMGVTGMVIDNDSSAAQASSFYFGALGENATCNNTTVTTDTGGCAVKLTQATLQ
ncbi:MAG TPA: hypothetical protein VMF66_17270 [Candidatus Acidoferrum sp.]|nr:hypothetical protein [Candidatus Acidoferrum sp.]